MPKPTYELASIIKEYKDLFYHKHPVLAHHKRTLHAIEICRTQALGGHVDKCNTCTHVRISYNSCRNRHCPKCQVTNKEKWILARQNDLLPTTYFHVVFTLPQELNTYCLHYPKALYNILLKPAKKPLKALATTKNI